MTPDEARLLYAAEKAKRAARETPQAAEVPAPKPVTRKRGEHGNVRDRKTGRWSRRSGPTQGEQ